MTELVDDLAEPVDRFDALVVEQVGPDGPTCIERKERAADADLVALAVAEVVEAEVEPESLAVDVAIGVVESYLVAIDVLAIVDRGMLAGAEQVVLAETEAPLVLAARAAELDIGLERPGVADPDIDVCCVLGRIVALRRHGRLGDEATSPQ